VTWVSNAGRMRAVALAAVVAVLCLPAAWARGQHSGAPRPIPLPRRQRIWPLPALNPPSLIRRCPKTRAAQPRNPKAARKDTGCRVRRPATPRRLHVRAIRAQRIPVQRARFISIRAPLLRGIWGTGSISTAIFPSRTRSECLRGDPAFNRLNSRDQQRLVQQLHQVNQMPDEQRQRRLARNEMIERLSPQERMRVNLSATRLASLPPIVMLW